MFRKVIFILVFMLCNTIILAGCSQTEQQISNIQSTLEVIQTDINNLKITPEPVEMESDYDFVLGQGLAINFEGTDNSAVFPLHGISVYGVYTTFWADWELLLNTSTSIKLAWIKTASETDTEWDFYYSDKMLAETAPAPISWQPFAILAGVTFPEPDSNVHTEYGPLETIVSSKSFPNTSVMEESRLALEQASGLADLSINTTERMILLVSDRTLGQDNYQLIIIDPLVEVPDENDDPVTAEYCNICQSWLCRWRCYWYGYPTP